MRHVVLAHPFRKPVALQRSGDLSREAAHAKSVQVLCAISWTTPGAGSGSSSSNRDLPGSGTPARPRHIASMGTPVDKAVDLALVVSPNAPAWYRAFLADYAVNSGDPFAVCRRHQPTGP
jgi:hypothetical protein